MTIDRLNELFVVDFLAGTLHWRIDRGRTAKAGDRAGTVNGRCYRCVGVDGKILSEHRIIVSMIEGRMLDDEHVDHVNGVRDDNRIENLRIVTRSENQRNRAEHRAGQPVGIYWDAASRKWKARIRLDGRLRHILIHPDQAVAARAFEIVDTMLKAGHTFDEAKAAARL